MPVKQLLLAKCSLVLLLACWVQAASAQAPYSYSCLLDGQPFNGKGTATISNAAFKTATDILSFALVATDPKYKGTVPPQIAFTISPNAATTIRGGGGKYSAKYSAAGELDNDYLGQQVTVTITSLTATRITGTFSGRFANHSKTILITDGKFDLPASPYSKPLN